MPSLTDHIKASHALTAQRPSRAVQLAHDLRQMIQPEGNGQLAVTISRDMALEIVAALEEQS